jgi:hypothetical protein
MALSDSSGYKNTKMVCVVGDELRDSLNQYSEKPMLSLNSNRIVDQGETNSIVKFQAILFVNASTGSWTLVERHSENLYCIAALGEQLKPFGQ